MDMMKVMIRIMMIKVMLIIYKPIWKKMIMSTLIIKKNKLMKTTNLKKRSQNKKEGPELKRKLVRNKNGNVLNVMNNLREKTLGKNI